MATYSVATNTKHKEFIEYITKELREEKVGVVTKLRLKDVSIGHVDWFMRSYFCTMGFFLIGLVYDGYFYRFGEWPVPLPVEWPPAAG